MTTSGAHVEQPADAVFEVLVIGAGQSGLAIGRQLQQRGRTFLIVDAGGEVGHVWRSRWDSLTLFTAARYSGLPACRSPATRTATPRKTLPRSTSAITPRRSNCRSGTTPGSPGSPGTKPVSRCTPTARPSVPPRWWWPPARSRTRSSQRSRRESGRTFRSCTAPPTATPTSCPTGRSWSSAPRTPARRSRQNCTGADPWRCPADPPPAHCRNGSWAETCSGGSRRPD